jgi:Fe-S-cluster containining protein
VEAAFVSRGIRKIDAEVRKRITNRATEYLEKRRALTAADGRPEVWGKLPPEGTRLACPALEEDGSCAIYEYRPLICRRYGVPVYNPDTGRVSACELNFRNGESIEDGKLIQIQTGIHERWKKVQGEYNAKGGYRDPVPISVGRAIVEDFSELG